MLKHPMLKYLKEKGPYGPRLPLILCPGCGAGQVLNFTLHAVDGIIREEMNHVVILNKRLQDLK